MARGRYRLTAFLAFLLVAGTIAAGWHRGHPAELVSHVGPAPVAAQSAALQSIPGESAPMELPSPSPHVTPDVVAAATGSPVLSLSIRRSCPAAASACVDLGDHLTWLQSGGRITYGPVRMEPGPPGTSNATPLGTFHVQWKAGANYVSTEYGEPMPYAVFFAPGGIAFHGGSLTKPSHGCVHLDIADARYFHDHLPIGAEVVVF